MHYFLKKLKLKKQKKIRPDTVRPGKPSPIKQRPARGPARLGLNAGLYLLKNFNGIDEITQNKNSKIKIKIKKKYIGSIHS
jgi:hypothetical protein